MQTILIVVHLFIALGLVGLVLIQHGKGADAGAAFGSGASATVFGSAGSGSFLSRVTAILAAVFFATSLGMAWYSMQTTEKKGLMDGVETSEQAVSVVAEAPAPTTPKDSVVIPGAGEEAKDAAGDVPKIPE